MGATHELDPENRVGEITGAGRPLEAVANARHELEGDFHGHEVSGGNHDVASADESLSRYIRSHDFYLNESVAARCSGSLRMTFSPMARHPAFAASTCLAFFQLTSWPFRYLYKTAAISTLKAFPADTPTIHWPRRWVELSSKNREQLQRMQGAKTLQSLTKTLR